MPSYGKSQAVAPADQAVEKESQTLIQAADNTLHNAVQEDVDTTDSNLRYAAYLRRIRDIARAGSSDIGEAFRPVVPPFLVTAAYGVSWAYLVGDVAFTTYKSSQLGPSPLESANMSESTRLSMVAVKRSAFQGIASMALPAFTIHTAVKRAGRQFAKSSNLTAKRWGPTIVGVGLVPALPYLFDRPVETAVDFAFEKLEEAFFRSKEGGITSPSTRKGEL